MPSPWAIIRNAQTPVQPETPSVWAPIPEEPLQQSDTAERNVLNHFGDEQGRPLAPEKVPAPLAQNLQYAQSELQKDREKIARPWGFAGAAPSAEFPNGLAPNHPGKLGKLAHVFSQAGNIAGNIVAPNVMAEIPGTQANMNAKESQLAKRVDVESTDQSENQSRDASTAKTQAEIPEVAPNAENERNYRTAETNKINEDLEMGPSLARGHDYAVTKAIKEGRDPATDPIVQHYEDAIQALQKSPVDKGGQHVALQDAHGKPYGATYDPVKRQYLDAAGNVIPSPIPYEKPMSVNVGLPEKAFEFSDKQLESLAKPLRDRSDRIERMKQTLAQGTPQADALIAPELLTAMAGGQGSGLRMNEAEIARIVGGRSAWENLKANMQHWSIDPTSARSITPDQQKQIRLLVNAIDAKVQKKIGILNEAGTALVGTTNPTEQHRLVAETRQRLQQEDLNQTIGDGETREYQGHQYQKGADGQWHLIQPKQ